MAAPRDRHRLSVDFKQLGLVTRLQRGVGEDELSLLHEMSEDFRRGPTLRTTSRCSGLTLTLVLVRIVLRVFVSGLGSARLIEPVFVLAFLGFLFQADPRK